MRGLNDGFRQGGFVVDIVRVKRQRLGIGIGGFLPMLRVEKRPAQHAPTFGIAGVGLQLVFQLADHHVNLIGRGGSVLICIVSLRWLRLLLHGGLLCWPRRNR